MQPASDTTMPTETIPTQKSRLETSVHLLTAGLEAYGHSDFELALEILIQTAQQAQFEDSWNIQAQALIAQGKVYRDQGNPETALEQLDCALELARVHGDALIEADALNQRAGINHLNGEYARALKDLTQALIVAGRFEDDRRAANCLINMGIIRIKLGDFPRALTALSDAHALVRERIHDRGIESQCLINLGLLYENMSDDVKALETYQSALTTLEGLENSVLEAITTTNLGYVYKRLGQLENASRSFEVVLLVAQQIKYPKFEIAALDGLGQVEASLGNFTTALQFHQKALDRALEINDVESEIDALLNIGRVHLKTTQAQQAIEALNKALERAEQTERKKAIFEAHELLAGAFEQVADVRQALKHFREFHRIEKTLFNQESEEKTRQLSIQFDLERAQHETEVYRLRTDLERTAKEQAEQTVRERTLELELGNQTIERQRQELQEKVVTLGKLLEQNEVLRSRLVLAATRSTTLNERFLRRLSAELHDGPAQDLGFALLKLDGDQLHAIAQNTTLEQQARYNKELEAIQTSIARALAEMRAIATGISLPELESLSLKETLLRVINNHKRRSQTEVQFVLEDTPAQLPLPVKITLYRLVQESLTNAFKHAGGQGQKVRLYRQNDALQLEVSDAGTGFEMNASLEQSEGLGLLGMRERVESVGGNFEIESQIGTGTKIKITLPLHHSSDTIT
jgi:signal transduction histidine kinase/Tfp pilus assembly protein PilF